MLADGPKHGGGRPGKNQSHDTAGFPTLAQIGITRDESSRYTKRRRDIWLALHPVEREENLGGASCATQKATQHKDRPQNQPQFAAATAAVTGETKSTINRHIARAEALGDDIQKVEGTSLDTGVELDALAKLPLPVPCINVRATVRRKVEKRLKRA